MIVDAFIFSHELDILEIRLHELAAVVDRFVLVEATHTFMGQRKPLHFAANRERFAPFLSRITPVVVEGLDQIADPWQRESRQRNAIVEGLTGLADDDLVLVSDADEIPRAAAVQELAVRPPKGGVMFEQPLFLYYVNLRATKEPWCGTRAWRRQQVLAKGGQAARTDVAPVTLPAAGWHYSSMGPPTDVLRKIRSYSHAPELSRVGLDEIIGCRRGAWPLDGRDRGLVVDNDYAPPRYLQQHRDRFADWFYGG